MLLGVVKLPLANAGELCFEPARDDVDGDAATTVRTFTTTANSPIAVMADAGDLFCSDCRVPQAREERRNELKLLCVQQKDLRERYRLVLKFLSDQPGLITDSTFTYI